MIQKHITKRQPLVNGTTMHFKLCSWINSKKMEGEGEREGVTGYDLVRPLYDEKAD